MDDSRIDSREGWPTLWPMSARNEPDRANSRRSVPAAALVVAHPGHELRVHRWIEIHRPSVYVLTDGSGHGDRGRLDSTRSVLRLAGGREGSVFGAWTDREAYRIVLERDLAAVTSVIEELAARFVEDEVEIVASDAVEGFNPSHDLCFVIAESASLLASRRSGRSVQHLDFLLEAAPDARLHGHAPANGGVRIELDRDAWQRKAESARSYPELREEVERALRSHSESAFQVEVLRPASSGANLAARAVPEGAEAPSYEIHGAGRVRSGTYDRVLRFREHWLPLVSGVREWTARRA